jgi:hypothetical protein
VLGHGLWQNPLPQVVKEGYSIQLYVAELAAGWGYTTLRPTAAAHYLVHAFQHGNFSFCNYREYLLDSPLGLTLSFQTSLAKHLYTASADSLEGLYQHFTRQLAVLST